MTPESFILTVGGIAWAVNAVMIASSHRPAAFLFGAVAVACFAVVRKAMQ